MLTIRCARCRAKLFKYAKLGKGAVVRCHKGRIARVLEARIEDGRLLCPCGAVIGHEKEGHYRMVRGAFTAAGRQ